MILLILIIRRFIVVRYAHRLFTDDGELNIKLMEYLLWMVFFLFTPLLIGQHLTEPFQDIVHGNLWDLPRKVDDHGKF